MSKKAIAFNDKEFMLLYMAVGSCYSDIRDYIVSPDFDTFSFEEQEIVLSNEQYMETLYHKMKDHATEIYPFSDVIFGRDTRKVSPNKNTQFQGNTHINGTS